MPLPFHQNSLAGNDADSESLQAQTSIIHSSDSNLPLGRQPSSPSPSNLALEASFYPYVPICAACYVWSLILKEI